MRISTDAATRYREKRLRPYSLGPLSVPGQKNTMVQGFDQIGEGLITGQIEIALMKRRLVTNEYVLPIDVNHLVPRSTMMQQFSSPAL